MLLLQRFVPVKPSQPLLDRHDGHDVGVGVVAREVVYEQKPRRAAFRVILGDDRLLLRRIMCQHHKVAVVPIVDHRPIVVVRVGILDVVDASEVAHYDSQVNVQYMQLDVLSDGFIPALRERVNDVGGRAVLLGIHLCGRLSFAAIQAFEQARLPP